MLDERSDWLARAQPDDDAPRLAFADWLDEHGEPDFARFIRLEIELDSLSGKDPRRQSLQEEAQSLRKKLPLEMRAKKFHTKTRRGFIDYAQGGPLQFLQALPQFGPYAPRLKVHLNGNSRKEHEAEEIFAQGGPDAVGEAIRELFTSSWVQSWTVLECHNLPLTEERLRSMIEPGQLLHLDHLSFEDSADDEAIRVLGETIWLQLVALEISEVNQRVLTTAMIRSLIDAPLLGQLQSLTLRGEWLGDEELEMLATSPKLASLKYLAPIGRHGAAKGLRALLKSPHLAKLERLNLSIYPYSYPIDPYIEPEVIALLVNPQELPGLRELEISFVDTVYRDLLLPRFGNGLLVSTSSDSEERRVAHLRLPYYFCMVHLPGPFAEEATKDLDNRVAVAIAATLLEHDLGKDVETAATPVDSPHEYVWNCSFHIYHIQKAVILLRDVLAKQNVQPDAIIQVTNPYYPDTFASYPLTPTSTDWDDLAEVERSTRIPDALRS